MKTEEEVKNYLKHTREVRKETEKRFMTYDNHHDLTYLDQLDADIRTLEWVLEYGC